MNFDVIIDHFAAAILQRIQGGDDLVELPGPLEPLAAQRLRKSGELPARKVGRKWFCRRSDLLALIPARMPANVVTQADSDEVAYAKLRVENRRR